VDGRGDPGRVRPVLGGGDGGAVGADPAEFGVVDGVQERRAGRELGELAPRQLREHGLARGGRVHGQGFPDQQRGRPRVLGAVVDVGHDDLEVAQQREVGRPAQGDVQVVQHLPDQRGWAHLLGEAAVQLRHPVAEPVAAHFLQADEVALLDEGADGAVDGWQRDADAAGDHLGGDPVTRGGHRLDHPQRAGDGGAGGAVRCHGVECRVEQATTTPTDRTGNPDGRR